MALKVQHKWLYEGTSISSLACFRLDYKTPFHSSTLQAWYFSLGHNGLDLPWSTKTWGCISLSYLIAGCLNYLAQSRAKSWFMWLKLPSQVFEVMVTQKSADVTHHKQAFNYLYGTRKYMSITQRSATSLLDFNSTDTHRCTHITCPVLFCCTYKLELAAVSSSGSSRTSSSKSLTFTCFTTSSSRESLEGCVWCTPVRNRYCSSQNVCYNTLGKLNSWVYLLLSNHRITEC